MPQVCEGAAEGKQQQAGSGPFQKRIDLSDCPERSNHTQLHLDTKIADQDRRPCPPEFPNRAARSSSAVDRRELGLGAVVRRELVMPAGDKLVRLLMIMNISLIAPTLRGRAACSCGL